MADQDLTGITLADFYKGRGLTDASPTEEKLAALKEVVELDGASPDCVDRRYTPEELLPIYEVGYCMQNEVGMPEDKFIADCLEALGFNDPHPIVETTSLPDTPEY